METFESIYEDNFNRIYAFLYRLCKNDDLAEELTQETFFQAFRSFYRFRGESELFTWLASITKHTFYAYLRKNRIQLESINIEPAADALYESGESSPEETVMRNAAIESVRNMISKIPEKYRDVIMLRLYADLPFSQVAAALKISENSAKVIFFRAKKMLLEELKNDYYM